MRFVAAVHRVAIDNEGESTVTLKCPSSELPKVIPLVALTQTALIFDVTESEHPESRNIIQDMPLPFDAATQNELIEDEELDK